MRRQGVYKAAQRAIVLTEKLQQTTNKDNPETT